MASNNIQVASSTKMHNIVNLFRAISHLVDSTPDILNEEGVFRTAGALNLTVEVINSCANKTAEQCVDELIAKKLSIHDLLALLPHALNDECLIDLPAHSHEPAVEDFINLIRFCATKEKFDSKKQQDTLITLITYLINSQVIALQQAGEILYHYLHIMTVSLHYEETTKMNVDNLAIVFAPTLLGPLNLLSMATDNKQTFAMVRNVQQILTPFFENRHAYQSFLKAFPEIVSHLCKTRESQLELLKQQEDKAVNMKPTETVTKALLQHNMTIFSLHQQLSSLKKNKEIGNDVKKEAKKALKKALKLEENNLSNTRKKFDSAVEKKERLHHCIGQIRQQRKQLRDSNSSIRHFHSLLFISEKKECQSDTNTSSIIATL